MSWTALNVVAHWLLLVLTTLSVRQLSLRAISGQWPALIHLAPTVFFHGLYAAVYLVIFWLVPLSHVISFHSIFHSP